MAETELIRLHRILAEAARLSNQGTTNASMVGTWMLVCLRDAVEADIAHEERDRATAALARARGQEQEKT